MQQEILKIITTSYEEGDPQSKKTADMQSCLICLRDYLHNQEAQFQPLSQIKVCTSNIFRATREPSDWSSKVLISCHVSTTKSLEIAPQISNPNEPVLNLIHKYKPNSNPLTIPVAPYESKDLIASLILMNTLFKNPIDFPCKLDGIESCNKLLQSTRDWDILGEKILKNFNLTPENIGGLFKSHLSNIVDSQIPVPEGDYQQQSQYTE